MLYKVYGLVIESDIEFNELMKAKDDEKANASIVFCKVSDEINHKIKLGNRNEFTNNMVWYSVKNVGTFCIEDGHKITVDVYKGANKEDVKIYTLGTAMGILLMQKNIVAIHGGTVRIDNKAVIISGDMGAGKSTLITALRLDGNELVSDDVSAITLNERNIPLVEAAYSQQKLCKDTMVKFGYDLNQYVVIDESREKYALPIETDFCSKATPLRMICKIEVGKVDEVTIREANGSEGIKVLLDNIYRKEIFTHLHMNATYFKKCINILQKVPVYILTRPEGKFSVDEQVKRIKDII